MTSRPVQVLYILLGLAASTAAGAFIAARWIESPADVAARTAPPQPSPILVPIERRLLSADVIVRGTVRFGRPMPLSLPPSNLKANPGRIAKLPLRNATVSEGDVLLSGSGRPVLALAGKVPAFRDLGPGMTGEDVRQLEEGLARIGFPPGKVNGVYDQWTATAVEAWYVARGFEPFGPTREQLAALATLERELDDAKRARIAATSAASTASQAVAAARASAEKMVQTATLEDASRASDRQALAEVGRLNTPLSVEAERARAELALATAEAEVRTRTADRAVIALDPRQPEIARLKADAQLEMAKAARERARLEGEQAVRLAQQDTQLAANRVRLAEVSIRAARLEGAKQVRAALDAQKVAEFDVELAVARFGQLSAAVANARGRLGVQVPADEVIFISALPARVEDVPVAVGAPASGVVLSVTDNKLAVDSALPLESASLVRPGMAVAIDERALGVRATGRVQWVDASPGTRGVDNFHFYMEVNVEDSPVRLEGLSVRLTIPVKSTEGEVLAVPVSAVSLGADGQSRVQVDRGGTLDFVAVTPGLAAGGFVEIKPKDGSLDPGQMVVVGYKVADARPGS